MLDRSSILIERPQRKQSKMEHGMKGLLTAAPGSFHPEDFCWPSDLMQLFKRSTVLQSRDVRDTPQGRKWIISSLSVSTLIALIC